MQKDKRTLKSSLYENTIPIAVATDEFYIVPTLVALKSLVIHTNERYRYIIFILVEKTLPLLTKRLFFSIVKEYYNVEIQFIVVGNKLKKVQLCENGPAKGISKTTYYRFLLPELITIHKKLLYIDTDILVCDDISNIFFADIGDNYLAGVRDIVGYQDVPGRCKELNIPSLDRYINAGVLVLNLEKLRITGTSREMIEAAYKIEFPYNDQDIINSLCYEHIGILPCRCNIIVDYINESALISKLLCIDYEVESSKPIILHYAGRAKPWYGNPNVYSSYWWTVAESINGITFLIEKLKFGILTRRKFK